MLRTWMRAVVRRMEFERLMQDEMRTHVEMYEADLRRAGLSPADAHRRARVEFGSVEARRDECREAFGLRWVDELRVDVRYALRLLWRSPGFTAVALLSLGLGIGANTAIFSLVDTVLLKSLPVVEPESLFFIDNSGGQSGGSSGPPYPCYERIRDNNRFLAGVSAFRESRLKITVDGTPEEMRGQHASGNYFDLLGVRPIAGRVLMPDDDVQGAAGVAVISHDLWRRRFNLSPSVIGTTVRVGTTPVTIVGITEPEFFGLQVGSPIDITIPMALTENNLRARRLWWFSVVGRLKRGADAEQARADIEAIWDNYLTEVGMPREKRGYFSGIALVPADKGLNALRRRMSEPLLIIMGIVALVLLVGCANVANLLLARATARQNEIAVRLASGASRSRVLQQLLTEGAVLMALGSIVGIVLAYWGLSFLTRLFATTGEGTFINSAIDGRVLIFATTVAVVTGLLFSLAPALRTVRSDMAKPGPATMSTTKPRAGLGRALIVVQVSLSLVLLCGAGAFLRTLHNLGSVESGFNRAGVLTMQVDATVPSARSGGAPSVDDRRREHARLGAMWEELVTRAHAVSGVTSAAVGTMLPLTGRDRGVLVAVTAGEPIRDSETYIHINQVSAGYFETMGIRVLSGRPFTSDDRSGSVRVTIVNEMAARTYFPADNAIGKRIRFPGQRIEDDYEIVGVVEDTRYENLRTPDERMAYLPIEQSIDPVNGVMLALRGPGDPWQLAVSMRRVAAEAVPGGFITKVATIEQRVSASLVRERLLTMLASFFAGLALTLACIGLYGMLAYAVVRRTREIGIRVAIGAHQRSVTWMVVREALALVGAGVLIGTLAAVAAARYISSQLFGVTPVDPLTMVAASMVLVGLTMAAAYLPAHRASRIRPMAALRCE